MQRHIKVVVEKHRDGYVTYPLGAKSVVIGQGDSFSEAFEDLQSAITFHVETFGPDVFVDSESPVVDAFVAEVYVQC